jgi:hypothetical protein
MLMEAKRPWTNWEHEGHVEPGQRFEATDHRARDLKMAGLAVPVMSDAHKVPVPSLPPPPRKVRTRPLSLRPLGA